MLQEADLLRDDAHDEADNISVHGAAGEIGDPERQQGHKAGLAEQDERGLVLGGQRGNELFLDNGGLRSLVAFKDGARPLHGTGVVALDEALGLAAQERSGERVADDALHRDNDRGQNTGELERIGRAERLDGVVDDDGGNPAAGDRADESHGEVVAQNRAGGEEHQNAAHDNDREAKHHGLPLGNELLEVKKRSHIDDEDAGHHIGNGDKAGIGEQSRRNNARPEQDQERDRGEEQYGDDGVRFVGNEVADREYNTHDRQG